MEFTMSEKLAIAKSVGELIASDGKIDLQEILYLQQLKEAVWFDDKIIEQARDMDIDDTIIILREMTDKKKLILRRIVEEMINADWEAADEEIEVWNFILMAAGFSAWNNGSLVVEMYEEACARKWKK